MKKLTNFELMGAEALLSAIPMRALPGSAVADVALALAVVASYLRTFNTAVADMANKLKPEGYDEKARQRMEKIKETFPDDGHPFDAEEWNRLCPDPDFEEVFQATEEAFTKAYNELGQKQVDVKISLTTDTLAAVASTLACEETVKVAQADVPYETFMRQLAMIAV